MDASQVIIRPVVSEKSYVLATADKYTFRVHPDAHKTQIRQAIEELFGVGVVEVRTSSVPSKPKRRGYTAGRTRAWKKAVVQVRPGDTIPIFQGLDADLSDHGDLQAPAHLARPALPLLPRLPGGHEGEGGSLARRGPHEIPRPQGQRRQRPAP